MCGKQDCGSCKCPTSSRAGQHTAPNASGNCSACGTKLIVRTNGGIRMYGHDSTQPQTAQVNEERPRPRPRPRQGILFTQSVATVITRERTKQRSRARARTPWQP